MLLSLHILVVCKVPCYEFKSVLDFEREMKLNTYVKQSLIFSVFNKAPNFSLKPPNLYQLFDLMTRHFCFIN